MAKYVVFNERLKGDGIGEITIREDAVISIRELQAMGPSTTKVIKGQRFEEPRVEGTYCELILARGVGVNVAHTRDEVLELLGSKVAGAVDVPEAKRPTK